MNRETRAYRAGEVRVPDDGSRTFEAVVVVYGVVDDYGTVFDAGCFSESLKNRMPRITWSHDWAEPIGRYVDFKDTDTELTLIGKLDDFDAVPRARQAWSQLRSGTIDEFSVGFTRDQITEDDDGHTHFVKAKLDEAALVLAGAVPGTKLVSVRSGKRTQVVPEELVIDLARKVHAEELTLAEAKVALDLAAGTQESGSGDDGSDGLTDEPVEPDPDDIAEDQALIEEADEVALEHGVTLSAPHESRGAIGPHSTSTVNSAWDGPAAMAGASSAEVLRYMSAWRDGAGDPGAKSSYKFPHHAPKVGSAANLNGVRNALARLPDSKIPDGDKAGVERHLRKHLKDAEK